MTARIVARSFELEGIERSRTGDGRTVTAYAAVFDTATMVVDRQFSPSPYLETIARTAFAKSLSEGAGTRSQVLFNHGKTIGGVDAERYAMPLGTPVEVKADGRGLLTVTRYARTPLADEVLELIDAGAIRGQSFRGPVLRHAERSAGVVELTELGLREYGPCPFPAYEGAEIVSIRSATDLMLAVGDLTDEQRADLARLLSTNSTTDTRPDDADTEADLTVTSDVTSSDAPSPDPEPSGPSLDQLALDNVRRRI